MPLLVSSTFVNTDCATEKPGMAANTAVRSESAKALILLRVSPLAFGIANQTYAAHDVYLAE